MSEIPPGHPLVVEVLPPHGETGLFSRKRRHKAPEHQLNAALFHQDSGEPNGAVRPVPSGGNEEFDSRTRFYRVHTGWLQQVPLTFSAIKEEDGHAWDFILEGAIQVTDPATFLCKHAVSLVAEGRPLTTSGLAAMLVKHVSQRVRIEADKLPIADLKGERRLAKSWWETRLTEWLGWQNIGVSVGVVALQWSSASAAAAEMERQEQEAQGQTKKVRESQLRAEREGVELEAKHIVELERIRADTTLGQRERDQQRHLVEQKFTAERLRAEKHVDDAKREAERSAAEHEYQLAKLKRQTAEERTAASKEELRAQGLPEANSREREDQEALIRQQAEDLKALKAEVMRKEERRDLVHFQQKHESSMRILENGLQGKQQSDGRSVVIKMAEIRTRGVGGRKTATVNINDSLEFRVTSDREGYVTLLNIGTSGQMHVLIPNQFIGVDAASIKANSQYSVPGAEFLPGDALRKAGFDGFVEAGPPGWEVLAMIVSTRPLMTPALLGSAEASGPFFTLRSNQVDEVTTRLAELKPDEWSVGIVSFLAECPKDLGHRW